MEYIATAALVVIAAGVARLSMDFHDFTRAFRDFKNSPQLYNLTRIFHLSQEDRDLLAEAAKNYRRNKPRVKKETKENTHSADGWIGRSGDVG